MWTKREQDWGMHTSAILRDRCRHSSTSFACWKGPPSGPPCSFQNSCAHMHTMRHWSGFFSSLALYCVARMMRFV